MLLLTADSEIMTCFVSIRARDDRAEVPTSSLSCPISTPGCPNLGCYNITGLEVIHYKSTAPIKGSSMAASVFYYFFSYTMAIRRVDKNSHKTFHGQEEADLYNKSHRLINDK